MVESNTTNMSGSYSALIWRGFNACACVRVRGRSVILQGPDSDLELHVPDDLDAFIMGHAHTDSAAFLHEIPAGECLVSPVAEYRCVFRNNVPENKLFKIKVPHSVRNKEDLRGIRVRHGDIHNNVPFTVMSPNSYEVDERFVYIYKSHFSQFICTSCKKICHRDGKAFIFGSISPPGHTPVTSTLRLYLCSPLYRIRDYKMV